MSLIDTVLAADKAPEASSTWARLFLQRHAEYDAEQWDKLRLLHEGGFEIQKNATKFLERIPHEPKKEYEWRCRTTAYINHMARVVGHLIGSLFGVPIKVSVAGKDGKPGAIPDEPFYKAFEKNCDLQGTEFSQFMRVSLVKALVAKRALIGVDMPGRVEAKNKLEEEKLGGARAWLYDIPLASMLDWNTDDLGQLQWCKLVKQVFDRSDPLGDHSAYYYEFKIWRLDPDAKVATFEVYRTRTVKDDNDFKDEEVIPQVVPPTATTFARIPIVVVELPAAIWAGNQLGPLCKEHYNGRSNLRGSMSRSLCEVPFVKLGTEIPAMHGALPAEVQQNPSRGNDPVGQAKAKGYLTLGAGDDFKFVGPSGAAWAVSSQENERVRDEIYSALNTMALALSNTAATNGRSGVSKKEDRSATGVILQYLADTTREMSEMVYDCVSDGRGESVEWTAGGVDSYDDEDREALIGEATEVETLTIPSPSFKKHYAKTLAMRLAPKASPELKQAFSDEIDANYTDEMAMPPKPMLGPPGAKPPGAGSAGSAGGKALPPGAGKTNLPPKPPIPGKG